MDYTQYSLLFSVSKTLEAPKMREFTFGLKIIYDCVHIYIYIYKIMLPILILFMTYPYPKLFGVTLSAVFKFFLKCLHVSIKIKYTNGINCIKS